MATDKISIRSDSFFSVSLAVGSVAGGSAFAVEIGRTTRG